MTEESIGDFNSTEIMNNDNVDQSMNNTDNNTTTINPNSLAANLLPLSSITKICKQVLPESLSIQKDSKAILQKATTVFISYLSTIAKDQGGDKKTMSVDQVYRALQVMEMDSVLLQPVKELVEINNEKVKAKREEYRQKAKMSNKTEAEIEAEIEQQVLQDLEDNDQTIPTKRRADEDLDSDNHGDGTGDGDVVME